MQIFIVFLKEVCHPGLNVRAGISSKWGVARGPGYLHRFRDDILLV